jgi:hypothetical protein
LQSQSSVLDRKKEILYSDRLEGIISQAQYLEFKAKLEQESEALLLEEQTMRAEISSLVKKASETTDGNGFMESFRFPSELSREMVEHLIESVHVHKHRKGEPQEITINWNF